MLLIDHRVTHPSLSPPSGREREREKIDDERILRAPRPDLKDRDGVRDRDGVSGQNNERKGECRTEKRKQQPERNGDQKGETAVGQVSNRF